MKEKKKPRNIDFLGFFSRRDVIRTRDLCVPNAALYQAEPRAENELNIKIINKKTLIVKEKTNIWREFVANWDKFSYNQFMSVGQKKCTE